MTPPDPTFAQILTRLRTEAGLSVAALAKAAGVTRATIYNLENGAGPPTWNTVQKLADALRVTTDALRVPS